MTTSRETPVAFDAESARTFCTGLLTTVDRLIALLDEETRLVAAARLRDAAELGSEKTALSERYARAHGVLKVSGRELGRHAAVEVDQIRRRHEAMEGAVMKNLAVLATARTVSETLIRGVAEAVSPNAARPSTYSADARTAGAVPSAGPLSLNVAL